MLLRILCVVALSLLVAPVAAETQTRRPPKKPAVKKVVYSCPMHPDVTSTKRGRCPKCGMDLRPVTPAPQPSPAPTPTESAETGNPFTSAKIANIRIYDQNGKQLNFYNDLIKGKTVAINFIFTTCTTICPPLTATFRRVAQEASQRGLDIQLISVSVDPVVDTPERLRDFAGKFKAGSDWTLVTGDKSEIDSLLKSLGVAVGDKNDHTPMVIVGNDAVDYWTRTYGLSSPAKLVDLIAEAAARK